MSKLIVEVCEISDVRKHPNADALELATIKGWQTVVPLGKYRDGGKVVYFPPMAVLPLELSDKLGVTKYLRKDGVVYAVRLRGEASFGLVADVNDVLNGEYEVGDDVADVLGIVKYEPPVKLSAGDAAGEVAEFPAYTSVENFQNYPDLPVDGEEWVFTEKAHGQNVRGGYANGQYMAGSHGVRRKEPSSWKDNTFWYPLSLPSVKSFVDAMIDAGHLQVIVYGEIYGPRIQSMDYGVKNGIGFQAFDIMIDGKYLDAVKFFEVCEWYGIPTVRVLGYATHNHLEAANEYSVGEAFAGNHIREGCVGRPVRERFDGRIGRVILKLKSVDFLAGKHSLKEVADV